MRLTLILAGVSVALTSLGAPALAQDDNTGRLVGVARNHGDALPGVRVTVTAGAAARPAITDPNGRFAFPALPPGSYVVTGELAGFETQTQRGVLVTAGSTRTLDIDLPVGCLNEVLYVDQGMARAVHDADAILHVRISEVRSPARWSMFDHCAIGAEHAATVVRVLGVLRGLAPAGSTIRFIQIEQPYAPGEEYVALLRWDRATNRFWPLAGRLFMFPVRDDRVVWNRSDAVTVRDGMSVNEFLAALDALRADASKQ